MEESHKEVLNDSLTFLKSHLVIDEVLDHLLEKSIITYDLKQRINYEKTDGSKVTELVCILCKRSQRAFDVFLEACRTTEQVHVAHHLEKRLTALKEKQYTSKTNFYTPQIMLYHTEYKT